MLEMQMRPVPELSAAVEEVAVAALSGTGRLRRVGVDVVDLVAFARQIEVVGERFLARLLTTAEMEYCGGRVEQLGTRVAAKEAAAKVLGTGFRGVGWRDIEVQTAANGRPSLILSGRAARAAADLGLTGIEVSCSHEGQFAFAVAVGESCETLVCADEGSAGGDRA